MEKAGTNVTGLRFFEWHLDRGITNRNKVPELHMMVQLVHSSLPELEHSKVLVLGSMVRIGGGNTS
ncbi:MAG: hypothetical protein O2856_11415 [Planctomycetota bacterium]|nr:hypothetical protein [Planctomycetota bacterium]